MKYLMNRAFVFVIILVIGSPIWASVCLDTMTSYIEISEKSELRLEHLENQVSMIDTPSELAEFFMRVGRLKGDRKDIVDAISEGIFRVFKSEEIQDLVKRFHFYYAHEVRRKISEYFNYKKEAPDDIRDSVYWNLKVDFINKKQFARWLAIGESLPSNKAFHQHLVDAISFIKKNDPDYGRHIDLKRSLTSIISQLESINSPSLVGRFMEQFISFDPVTRAYLISKISNFKYLNSENSRYALTLYLPNLVDRHRTPESQIASKISDVFLERPNEIQERAFFEFELGGSSKRPDISVLDKALIQKVAIRYILNKESTMDRDEVFGFMRAIEFLSKIPKNNDRIDLVFKNVIENGSKLEYDEYDARFYFYGIIELYQLARYSSGYSKLRIEPLNAIRQLQDFKSHGIMWHIIDFHNKHDLNNFPDLKDAAVVYFRNNLNSLTEQKANLMDLDYDKVIAPLKKDLGLN